MFTSPQYQGEIFILEQLVRKPGNQGSAEKVCSMLLRFSVGLFCPPVLTCETAVPTRLFVYPFCQSLIFVSLQQRHTKRDLNIFISNK